MCPKVLNGQNSLITIGVTTILAPEMTYTPKIYTVFELSYHHIRNFESKSSVIVSRLSTLLATASKLMPFAHRVS